MATLRQLRQLGSKDKPTSVLAVASEGAFLAAGTTADSTEIPELLIMRSTAGCNLFKVAVSFPSPAAFCRVSWSKPLASGYSSSPVGLVAGGLENGVVFVWDPKHKLRDWYPPSCMRNLQGDRSISTDFKVIDDYFVPDKHRELYLQGEMPLMRNLQGDRWISTDFKLIDDYFAPDKHREAPPLPPRFDQATRNLQTPEAVTGGHRGMVAAFKLQSCPVRGLSFSPLAPNLLASGAEKGGIMVWDLSNASAQSVPNFQHDFSPSMGISSLAWSKLRPNIFACSSFAGKTCLLDMSSKSPMFSDCDCERRCSSLDFSPVDENMLLVSCEDNLDSPSLLLWDLRQMRDPVRRFCHNSQVNAMSWSPWNDEMVVVSTNNKKVIVYNMHSEEVVAEVDTLRRSFDVHWSKTSRGSVLAASDERLTLYQLE